MNKSDFTIYDNHVKLENKKTKHDNNMTKTKFFSVLYFTKVLGPDW